MEFKELLASLTAEHVVKWLGPLPHSVVTCRNSAETGTRGMDGGQAV